MALTLPVPGEHQRMDGDGGFLLLLDMAIAQLIPLLFLSLMPVNAYDQFLFFLGTGDGFLQSSSS